MKYVRNAMKGRGSKAINVSEGLSDPMKASANENVVIVFAEYIRAGPRNSLIAAISFVVRAIKEPVGFL